MKKIEPFKTNSEANESLLAFYAELGELRTKHRISDVHLVVRVEVEDAEEGLGEAMASFFYGEYIRRESLAAFGLGHAAAERSEAVMRAMKRGRKQK